MQALLRRFFLGTLLLGALAAPLQAQGGDDDYDFSEIPVEEEEIPYIGVGGGYQLQMVLLNLDDLNNLSTSLGLDKFEGGLFMHGGGGWTAIGIIPNVRLGVFGGGGSKEVTDELMLGQVSHKRSLQFSNGFTAALIDYAFTPAGRFTIAPGLMIGGGSTTVEYTQTRQDVTFTGLFDSLAVNAPGSGNRQASMTRSYVHFVPMVNLEYPLTQFILLRVGGGYSMSFGGTWSDRHGTDIPNVPDKLTADGPTLQVGLFLGLFQQ